MEFCTEAKLIISKQSTIEELQKFFEESLPERLWEYTVSIEINYDVGKLAKVLIDNRRVKFKSIQLSYFTLKDCCNDNSFE